MNSADSTSRDLFFLDVLRLYRYVVNIYACFGFLVFAYEKEAYYTVCIVIAFVKRIEICSRDFVE